MISRGCFKFALLTFLTLSLLPISSASAEVFVSEQFGFHFSAPDGFFEQVDEQPMVLDDGTPTTVVLFAEDIQTDEMLIAIYIQRLGQIVDPNQRLDLEKLPKQDAIKVSLESRRWQKTELQVIKQEANLGLGMDILGYIIQFPLKDEAIQIRVQGPQSRSAEVLKAFNLAVDGFVNTKTYIMSIEPTRNLDDSAQGAKLILGLFVTVALGVFFICVSGRVCKPQGNRPLGVVLVAFLGLCSSAWIAGQHLLTLTTVFSNPDGSVNMSNAFAVNLIGDLFFSLIATVAFVGLIFGMTWGWWASTTYWTWRICNQVFLPFATSFATAQSTGLGGINFPWFPLKFDRNWIAACVSLQK